ncbi:hypothetical protein, conserved [Plasmodium gonderi]|uniref:PPM-type phosphatase domain-containing protein n=1 Tax=Plasmodium gonderi TaxID=77519 RepID=A0A1Y1JCF4_PLAGO|nr:hypothetical protein, conserved [Plasmodium gonderi]GAW78887.1 hypothetical protein, conserved [Plasmodium gonderi]
MKQLLKKCLSDSSVDHVISVEEGLFQTCKMIVGLGDDVDELNCMQNGNIENDFLCMPDNYAKKNCVEGLRMSGSNGGKFECMVNLNEYCENNFNKMFNIEYIDLPLLFYETIFLNFFSSFMDRRKDKEKEEICWEDNIYIMHKLYQKLESQKYILLHKAKSIPNQKKKKKNLNYKNGDAYLCSDNIIAIADGVSSIKYSGINVSNFSNELLKKCLNLYIHRSVNNKLFEEQNRVIFNQHSVKYKTEEMLKPIVCRSACSSNFLGASTLLISSMEKEKLHVCTIGDCQMLILRFKSNFLIDKCIREVHLKIESNEDMSHSTKRESDVMDTLDDEKYGYTQNEIPYEQTDDYTLNPDQQISDKLISSQHSSNSMKCNSKKNDPFITPLVSNSKKGIAHDNMKDDKFKLKKLYSQRKKMHNNNAFKNISADMVKTSNCDYITLYMEEELSEDIYEDFEEYLGENNYKIGNLLFVIKDEDVPPVSDITSETITEHNLNLKFDPNFSQNCSHTTENNISENFNQPISTQTTMDESGYRNLLNFFDMDRTDISAIERERKNEKNVFKKYNEGNLEIMTENVETCLDEENSQKCTNINQFNNYRFRYFDHERNYFDIIYKSKIQQHYFNCPYQITFMPTNLKSNVQNNKNTQNSTKSKVKMNTYNDIISKCLRYCEYSIIDIKTNDVIISGSDGLFDNLYDDDIMEILFNNFYIVKCNKFISLKKVINFYDEFRKTLNRINRMISNNWKKGNVSKCVFKGNTSQSDNINVKIDQCGGEIISEETSTTNRGVTSSNRNSEVNLEILKKREKTDKFNDDKECEHKSEVNYSEGKNVESDTLNDASNDGDGKIADLLSRKVNTYDYLDRHGLDGSVYENIFDDKKNKENGDNTFSSKKHKNNIDTAMLKLKFQSKMKSMFSMRTNNKHEITAKNREKSDKKLERSLKKSEKNQKKGEKSQKKGEKSQKKGEKNGNVEENDDNEHKIISYIVKNDSSKSFVKNKTIDYDEHSSNQSEQTEQSEHSAQFIYENGEGSNVRENLKNKQSWEKFTECDEAYSEDLNLYNSDKSMKICSSNEWKGLGNITHNKGDKNLKTNETVFCAVNAHSNDPHVMERKRTTEIIKKDLISGVRRENFHTEDIYITEQNILTEIPDLNSYFKDGVGGEKNEKKKIKKKLFIQGKIDCGILLYEPNDFVLFDESNNIYLNTKKACNELAELASILANQEMNKTLLRKRRKKYNAENINTNMKEEKRNPESTLTCEVKGEYENDKPSSKYSLSSTHEKETQLFDKVNYDDMKSNKSNDKIILTPISQFIFDKYNKYFNMGKPDDITVILSVVKENKYNL